MNLTDDQEKMVWMIDFQGWTMGSTPLKVTRETVSVLQDCYPERLGLAILYNPPRLFESFYKVSSCTTSIITLWTAFLPFVFHIQEKKVLLCQYSTILCCIANSLVRSQLFSYPTNLSFFLRNTNLSFLIYVSCIASWYLAVSSNISVLAYICFSMNQPLKNPLWCAMFPDTKPKLWKHL